MNASVTFAERFRELLSERGDSQYAAANKIGVSQAWVSRMLNQSAMPSACLLEKIILVYQLDADEWAPLCGFSPIGRRMFQNEDEVVNTYPFAKKLVNLIAGERQAETAKRLGITPSYVGKLARGEYHPSRGLVERIIAVYGVPAAEWLAAAGYSEKDGVRTRLYDYKTVRAGSDASDEYLTTVFNRWESEGWELLSVAKNDVFCAVFRRPKS